MSMLYTCRSLCVLPVSPNVVVWSCDHSTCVQLRCAQTEKSQAEEEATRLQKFALYLSTLVDRTTAPGVSRHAFAYAADAGPTARHNSRRPHATAGFATVSSAEALLRAQLAEVRSCCMRW